MKTVSQEKQSAQVLNVPVNLIDTEAQVRTEFNETSIAQLAADIRDNGLLQPIVVRPNGDRYRLLIGERRLRAMRMIGAETAPAIIAAVPDVLAQHVQLMENIQREDLNAKDLAAAIKTIWDKLGSSAAVAKAVHKSPSWVSKRLSLALNAGISTTALIDGNIKDIELLYQFAKLEKINPASAANLVPHVLMGTIGREQVVDHLVGLDNDGQVAIKKLQQSTVKPPLRGHRRRRDRSRPGPRNREIT